jgi:hypothetical protein
MTKAKRTEKLSLRVRAQGVGKNAGRLLDDLNKMVEEAAGRPANRQTAAKKTAGERRRNARRRQTEAKRTAAGKRAKSR